MLRGTLCFLVAADAAAAVVRTMAAATANAALNDMSASLVRSGQLFGSGGIGDRPQQIARCRNPCSCAQPILPHEHRRPATIPSRRTEPPDARLAFALRKNRHAIARRARIGIAAC